MANAAAVQEAERLFAERLGVEQRVAARLMRLIENTYTNEIAGAKRSDLLEAARWAAERLRRRGPDDLPDMSRSEVETILQDSGCPLCASSGDEKFYGIDDGEPQGGAQSQGGASA